MQLTKHHGLGNDFLIALADALPADAPAMAQAVCHRTRGIGADGLIFGLPGDAGEGTDVTMVLFNADGSRAEMSGNGIRCLAQALFRRDCLNKAGLGRQLKITTDAGIRTVTVTDGDHPGQVHAWVEMGPITPGPELGSIDFSEGLRFITADVGNPHLVVQVSNADEVDVATIGARLTKAGGGINVEFISPRSDGEGIDMRVWERGVGVTQACGTGACAAAQAAYDWGLSIQPVRVCMPGGNVAVQLGENAVLVGPAEYIATVDYG
jgi:diaminopimelate epimerase